MKSLFRRFFEKFKKKDETIDEAPDYSIAAEMAERTLPSVIPGTNYINRELSWINFNERILSLSMDRRRDINERIKFFIIYQTNLDEFYRVRIGKIKRRADSPHQIYETKTGKSMSDLIAKVNDTIRELEPKREMAYELIRYDLKKEDVEITEESRLSKKERLALRKRLPDLFARLQLSFYKPDVNFEAENMRCYGIAMFQSGTTPYEYGIVSWSKEEDELIHVPGSDKRLLLTDIVRNHMTEIFAGHKILGAAVIRAARSAEIDIFSLRERRESYRDLIEEMVYEREEKEFVRVEVLNGFGNIKRLICGIFRIDYNSIIEEKYAVDYHFLSDLVKRKEKEPKQIERILPEEGKIDAILARDYLLSYPENSFVEYVELLEEAAEDERVSSIMISIYRLAEESKVAAALIKAAENGKNVSVIMELKARFSELDNSNYSRLFERSGVRVYYAFSGLKTHAKLSLISLMDGAFGRYILQAGTGNYNEITAKSYTDLSLLTSNNALCEEARRLFDNIINEELGEVSGEMLISPKYMKKPIIAMIEAEEKKVKEGKKGFIGIKVNGLNDRAIIDKLMHAANNGVKVRLIVRGICSLKLPFEKIITLDSEKMPAKCDIEVRSIVGKYLEHSRVYIFGTGDTEKIYISSADLMSRNVKRRVEAAVPVYDKEIKARIRYMFNSLLEDEESGWVMREDGSYSPGKSVEL